MLPEEFDIGDRLRLKVVFTNLDDEPTDPTTATVRIRTPAGVETSFPATASGPVGNWHRDVDITESGLWTFQFVGTGAVKAAEEDSFFVRTSTFGSPVETALASFGDFVARLGYAPDSYEAPRALQLLRAASDLIRDEGGAIGAAWTTATASARIKDICLSVAYRAFVNPEALNQHTLGDENKGFDRAGVGGGEGIYLTKSELKAIRKAAGRSSFVSVTLVTPFSGELEDEIIIAQ